MIRFWRILAFCVSLSGVFLPAGIALGADALREIDGLPFSLALDRRMQVRMLQAQEAGWLALASAASVNLTGLDVLAITWPKSKRELQLGVGTVGEGRLPGAPMFTTLLAAVDTLGVGVLEQTREPLPGLVSRIGIWPTNLSEGDLVVVFSLALLTSNDSPVYAFRVSRDGLITDIQTSGAQSSYGGFDLSDLDNDGDFELVTSRNLDGVPGGFSYRAVRSLSAGSYSPDPDPFKSSLFREELEFFDWVISTRHTIQQDPEPFLDHNYFGYYYSAEFRGQRYGFDSLIELPHAAAMQSGGLDTYNRQRQDAFRRVVEYRDALAQWLGGGPRPLAWKLSNEANH